ncbi:MFS transporter [Olivibacter sp. SDN3]|uniref:MFS transporter n=1 Tax=Olivibacter sp. SDN3 TaxID=2764720 RepID=UPI00165147BB|nr:MFS transporter [Olivibacter sp. SDN3]QNL49418.1 MFS transporter [Olivibacter sp. SDN3]
MTKKSKPFLSTGQLINMSFGFLGIQIGFALQSGNASRILQTFGADVEHLSLFWLAAPLTGMIVQPIIGHYSDKTWTRIGRRRPFFLVGALFTALALVLMPNAAILTTILPPLFIGAGLLMIMDASINVTMEPFRALIADNLPNGQRSQGFSIQTFLIGIGAVVGSWLPYVLAEWLDVSKIAAPGHVPDNVIFSFYIGALVLILTILWTVIRTPEYTPEELSSFTESREIPADQEKNKGLRDIVADFKQMPKTMKQLGLVQFFSWFALFSMWVFTTPAIATHVYNVESGDSSSTAFADAGNWVGVLFGVYNVISALYALTLPAMAKRFGQKTTHAISLCFGGIGLIAIYFIKDPYLLLLPMLGIGMAWGSILSMPYAMLSATLPARKMGVYMGIFNFFITFPQIVNGLFGGYLVKYAFGGHAIYALVLAGFFMLFAAAAALRIKHNSELARGN